MRANPTSSAKKGKAPQDAFYFWSRPTKLATLIAP
jgi:hypothetical protein